VPRTRPRCDRQRRLTIDADGRGGGARPRGRLSFLDAGGYAAHAPSSRTTAGAPLLETTRSLLVPGARRRGPQGRLLVAQSSITRDRRQAGQCPRPDRSRSESASLGAAVARSRVSPPLTRSACDVGVAGAAAPTRPRPTSKVSRG